MSRNQANLHFGVTGGIVASAVGVCVVFSSYGRYLGYAASLLRQCVGWVCGARAHVAVALFGLAVYTARLVVAWARLAARPI